MEKTIRILMLEDNPADTELVERELLKGKIDFTSKVVDTKEDFQKALEDFTPDIILSDYSLPSFDGISAMLMSKAKYPDTPFIFVSGVIGEDLAIETLKSGATDYVLKGKLSRLVPAMRRALEESEARAERKKTEEALRSSEEKYRGLFDESIAAVYVFDKKKNFINANPAGLDLLRYTKKELLTMSIPDVDANPKVVLSVHEQLLSGERIINYEHKLKRKDGRIITVLNNSRPLIDLDGKVVGMQSTLIDISERKRAEEKTRQKQRLNELLLDSLPYAAMIIHKNRTVLATNRAAREMGVKVGGICWRDYGKSSSIPEKDKRYIEEHKKPPKSGTRCVFCQAEKALKAMETVKMDVEIGNNVWDTHWIPIDNETYLHFAVNITERRDFETSLKESRDWLNMSQEIGHLGTWDQRLDDNTLLWSDETYRIFGLKPQASEMTFEEFLKFVHPEDRAQVKEQTQKVLSSKDYKHQIEYRIKRPDGHERFIYERAETVYDDKGIPHRLVGMIQDITVRKQAEETLQASEEKYSTVVENSLDAIIIHQEGVIRFVNSATAHLTGYRVEDFIGKNIMDYIVPEHREQVAKNYADRLAGKDLPNIYEIELIKKDGSTFPVEINATIIDYLGKPSALVYLRDITERKKAEEDVRESEEQHRSLVESLTDAVISIDENMKITLWNLCAERIMGYSRDEVLGTSIEFLVPEKYWESHKKGMKRFLKTGKLKVIGKTVELEAKRKDGKIIPIELSLSAVKREGKYMFTGIIRDITERKKAENEVQRSKEFLDRVIDGSADAIVTTDSNGNVTTWSRGAEALYGFSAEEVLGKPVHILYPKEFSDERRKWQKKITAGQTLYNIETKVYIKEGELRDISLSLSPLKDGEGRIVGTVGVSKDITEIKRINAEMRKKVRELEKWYNLTVDRELKMVELKKKIKELEAEIERVRGGG